MQKLFILMICIFHMHTALRPYPYYPPSKQQLFGEITTNEIGKQHEIRWAVPLVTREVIFAFPSVSIFALIITSEADEALNFQLIFVTGTEYRVAVRSFLFHSWYFACEPEQQ